MPNTEHTTPNTARLLTLSTLLHSVPSTFFLYGEPFWATRRFGWDAGTIALTQALSGACIAFGSWAGGRLAHRKHPAAAMAAGLAVAWLGVLLGWWGMGVGAGPTLAAFALVSGAQAMVWPGVEAGLLGRLSPAAVPHAVGRFNLTWSLGTSTAFLLATPILARFGPGAAFVVPALGYTAHLLFLGAFLWRPLSASGAAPEDAPEIPTDIFAAAPHDAAEPDSRSLSPSQRAAFRWLGWLANPLGYVAILVVVTYNPATAARLGLRFEEASLWFGLWFYVRTGSFELFRRWAWWHYRWRFLCGVFVVTMGSFAALVAAPNLFALVLAQVVFGLGLGLIYQSSLFYSMAGSDAHGEHGGAHETFIGLGSALGPLIVWGGSALFPSQPYAPLLSVLVLMVCGLFALLTLGRRTAT